MQSADIVFLDEMFGPDIDFVGRYIRVTGTILHLFEMERYCEISFKNNTLYIDLSITDMIGMKVGALFQFIGEIMDYRTSLKSFNNCYADIYMSAKIARQVDGLDLILYEKTIKMRRKFLEYNLPKND